MTDLVERIPVYAVTNRPAALAGARVLMDPDRMTVPAAASR
jgi:glucokinase